MNIQPAKKRKGVYKFVTHQDLTYETQLLNYEFENDWLKISGDGVIVVKGSYSHGYAWDGCSPKWNFFDLWLLGTPDGRNLVNTQKPITYYASLIHDILLQYQSDIGITRKEADRIFLHFLGDFSSRYLYYFAVRAFGIAKELTAKWLGKTDKT